MNRGSAGAPLVAVALAGMLVVLSFPSPAAASESQGAGPCVGYGLPPPPVHADPACLEGGAGSKNPFEVSAMSQAFGTQVEWEYLGDPAIVVEYEVFRGPTPWALEEIVSFNVTQLEVASGEYFDEFSPRMAGEPWYAVGAVIQENGTAQPRFVMSDAYLVQVTH